MNDCTFKPYIEPYHDGELEEGLRRRMEAHFGGCAACATELAAIWELSAMIGREATGEMRPDELKGVHEAVDRAAESVLAGRMLIRTAGMMATLAASVLIISGVWLMDIPQGPRTGMVRGNTPAALAPEWERIATTLRADPRPGLVDDDAYFTPRYASAVDWMLNSLAPMER